MIQVKLIYEKGSETIEASAAVLQEIRETFRWKGKKVIAIKYPDGRTHNLQTGKWSEP